MGRVSRAGEGSGGRDGCAENTPRLRPSPARETRTAVRRRSRPMSRTAPLVVIALVGGLCAAPGPEPDGVAVEGDDCRLLLLVDFRPRLVRFHVQTGGKPYRVSWENSISELFRYLDVNGDGVLDEKELSRAPSDAQLLRIFQGAEDLQPDPPPEFKLVAGTGADKRITRDRLAAYYSLSPSKPFAGEWIVKEGSTDAPSDALFRLLDSDKDGKLSPSELAAAPAVLGKFDTDLDELISPAELVPAESFERYSRPSLDRPPPGKLPPFFVLDFSTSSDAAVEHLLTRFDKDKDGRLSPKEIGFDDAEFARLDANKDGALDRQ